jgi:hypothetical protein
MLHNRLAPLERGRSPNRRSQVRALSPLSVDRRTPQPRVLPELAVATSFCPQGRTVPSRPQSQSGRAAAAPPLVMRANEARETFPDPPATLISHPATRVLGLGKPPKAFTRRRRSHANDVAPIIGATVATSQAALPRRPPGVREPVEG